MCKLAIYKLAVDACWNKDELLTMGRSGVGDKVGKKVEQLLDGRYTSFSTCITLHVVDNETSCL